MTRRRSKKRSKKKSKSPRIGRWIVFLVVTAGLLTACFFYFFKGVVRQKVVVSKNKMLAESPKGFVSMGIDVSHHQGEIDWNRLFNTLRYDTLLRFVYCKATEGVDHIDTRWNANRKELNGLGILNGAYHFFDPKGLPRLQAAHFLSQWIPREIDLPPMLDVETEGFSDEDLIAKMKIWLTEVEAQSGYRPIIYTSLHFYETKFKGRFPGYFFWIAAYTRKPPIDSDPQIIHWQYSETGRLPGIREYVDLNVSKVAF